MEPIQQLLTAQRVSSDLVKSEEIVKHLTESSFLAGSLSNGTAKKLLNSLEDDKKSVKNLEDNIVVHQYLLSKYTHVKTNVKLTCKQLDIAIEELKHEIHLIKFQKDPKLHKELKFTVKLLKKLEHKHKKQCDCTK